MKFFAREEEIKSLRDIREKSRRFPKMTVVTGRRRVGKTELLKHALNDGADTFVLDEFQEFDRINPGVFGEVAGIWDDFHNRSKLNLVVCGSVNRLMNKVFFNCGEPLYGRNTGHLHLEPFKISVIKKIFASFKPSYDKDDLLALWMLTGGVARYVELLMENGAWTRKSMVKTVFGGIGGWWDRKGENAIDLVVDNEFGEKIKFVEIKRDAARISLSDLKEKSEAFYAKNPNLRSRRASFSGLSIKDM